MRWTARFFNEAEQDCVFRRYADTLGRKQGALPVRLSDRAFTIESPDHLGFSKDLDRSISGAVPRNSVPLLCHYRVEGDVRSWIVGFPHWEETPHRISVTANTGLDVPRSDDVLNEHVH